MKELTHQDMPPMDAKSGNNEGKALAVQSVLERLGGDEELLCEVIDLFIEEVPDILTTLEAAIESGDWESAAKLAHTLKGSSSNVGAERFASVVLELENHSKEENSSGAIKAYRTLRDEFAAVKQFVSDPTWIKSGG
ncbi:MAG TPA: Hpt domain-containing protein [Deltaproteobacteria bacterium]|nr:Hpt domain-containing protein [Deltaproteobacteria bacterium]